MPPTEYVKLDNREHCLERYGMYIGDIHPEAALVWVHEPPAAPPPEPEPEPEPPAAKRPKTAGHRMVLREVSLVPGLLKIFDEVLVNALDHIVRVTERAAAGEDVKPVKDIAVTIDRATGAIEVRNSGSGIDVYRDETHDMYVPELLFGCMLTSSNFNDSVERTIGGMNGIGAKATNIFSLEFEVDTVDHVRRLRYTQRFFENMARRDPPVVKPYAKAPYTRVRFVPDYARFGMPEGVTADMYAVLVRRVFDACACTPKGVRVLLDGEVLPYRDFQEYTQLYLPASEPRVAFASEDGRWEAVVAASADGFQHVSFVNGCCTLFGGKHVDHVVAQLCKKLGDLIAKRRKVTVKPASVRECLFLFLKAVIVNPTFDSQSKHRLTTVATKFGSKFEVDDKTCEKILRATNVADLVADRSRTAADKSLKQTDGRKKSSVSGIPKLQDAIRAGTARSAETSLILCEGDSAATFCTSGLAEVGRETFGVFPLRGKLLNVNDCSVEKLSGNKEIAELKQILGLVSGRVYRDVSELRYGRIVILTDSDVDGSHIKGLIINMFHTLWPSLLCVPGFLTTMATPLVKVRPRGGEVIPFYRTTDFERWAAEHRGETYTSKYYKGLGTSTPAEARECFRDMRLTVIAAREERCESVDLAFNKKRSDDRKEWLMSYDKSAQTDPLAAEVDVSDFVHRELVHFSMYNLDRSIPSAVDGLKPSQRKILYACFKRRLTAELKVAQLAGYVAENSAYHHGEKSLMDAIVGLAQDFVGSNNVNLLVPVGQFGSRIDGGKDAASPRYIFTHLSELALALFDARDEGLLEYVRDDGETVEPVYYVPVLPMVLVNGCHGIATGYSTSVPCHDPRDLCRALRARLDGIQADSDIRPWYRGFRGAIRETSPGRYESVGAYHRTDTATLEITELPLFMWTDRYREILEKLVSDGALREYASHHTDVAARFVLTFPDAATLDRLLEADGAALEKTLHLTSSQELRTTNMHLFDPAGNIRRYGGVAEILADHFEVRLRFYGLRKAAVIADLEARSRAAAQKLAFIEDVIEGRLVLANAPMAAVSEYLTAHGFDPSPGGGGYDHLVRMPMSSLTRERADRLRADVAELEQHLVVARATSPEDMFRADLQRVEDLFEKLLAADAAAAAAADAACRHTPSSSGGRRGKKRA